MVAFYAGLGLVMITGILAIVEMSMGFVLQQNRWEPNNIYSKISPSAASLDRDWLQVLDIINNVNVNNSSMKDLALWGQNGSRLRSCTCYLLERSVFGRSEEKLSEDECLLGQDDDSEPIFPSNLIAKNTRSVQSLFAREPLPPATFFLTSCDFKSAASIVGSDVTMKHRVLIFPDSASKTLKLYSCAFDDKKSDQCSFEKS